MTYNVHSCEGVDGKRSITRIAEVIARAEPDVVALQELDAHRPRSDQHRQAELIAEALGMRYHFHPAIHLQDEQYGDALLTPHPMELLQASALPQAWSPIWNEKRGALAARISVEGQDWHIINTHFGLGSRERMLQAQALVGPEWLGAADPGLPLALCGDFNSLPFRRTHTFLRSHLRDAQLADGRRRPQSSFPSRRPMICLDYVFVNARVRVDSACVQTGPLESIASDHLPLVVDLSVIL